MRASAIRSQAFDMRRVIPGVDRRIEAVTDTAAGKPVPPPTQPRSGDMPLQPVPSVSVPVARRTLVQEALATGADLLGAISWHVMEHGHEPTTLSQAALTALNW